MLSTVHLIDDVIIEGTSGTTQAFANHWGPFGATNIQILGPGNLGRIDLVNYAVDLINPLDNGFVGTGNVEIRGSAQSIRIIDRRRGDIPSPSVPDVHLVDLDSASPTVRSLVLTGDYDSATMNGSPQVKASIPVDSIYVATRTRTPGGIVSPVLQTATGTVIGLFDFAGDLNGPANILQHAAGSIYGTTLRGSHRNAGGGSPVNVATGLILTYAWYKDLAYNNGDVDFLSGPGTVLHDNDYYEPPATVYAEDTFTASDATALSARTLSPTSPGHNWAVLEGAGAQQTIVSNAARLDAASVIQSLVVDCDQADGTLTVSAAMGTVSGNGAGLVFRVTDSDNYWQLWMNGTISDNRFELYKTEATISTRVGHIDTVLGTSPHVLKAVLAGNSINVYCDGALVISLTDSFNATATTHGIRAYLVVATFDGFKMTS